MIGPQYRESGVVSLTLHGKTIPDVMLAIQPQSSNTMWRWWIPRLGVEAKGVTRVDFSVKSDTEWQHKCDVDRDIRESVMAHVWVGE